jgi:asparagine synthase (glutamine-hydrolysing)
MSAIFGIINKDGKPVDELKINAMRNAIAHRATDGQASFVHGNAAFGHCRLYVHPQQLFEHQPYCTGNLVITADVRLDNRTDLAKALDFDHRQLAGTSDDRLILMAFRKWGKKCVDHLEGEYAFAIWDTESRELFAAIDHIGFRPFFYYDSPDQFIFCSEIKGVVAAKPLPNYFEEESLIEYFYRKGTPNKTYNKEVFALCGGNALTLKDGRMDICKYWTLESTGKYHFKKDEEWYDCTRDLLYKAVEKRLNMEVPTGITLSGGLDSTSIACILSELLMKKNKPLYAFSSVLPVDYKGIEKDERHYIEIVGKHCPNIIQTYVEAPGVGPFSDLKEAFKVEEFFLSSTSYMDRALLHEAKGKNVRVLFSGFGGDYWISWKGNSVIYELIKQANYKDAFRLIRQFSETEQRSFLHIFRSMFISHMTWYQNIRKQLKGAKTNWQKQTPLYDRFVKEYSKQISQNEKCSNTELMQTLTNTGKIGRMLGQFYNKGLSYNISTATPLFDKQIFELLSDLPLHLFVNGGYRRSLIRHVMVGINPIEINKRVDKLPFSPECIKRIYADRDIVKQMAETSSYGFIFDNYIDKEIINNNIESISSVLSGTDEDIKGLRMAQSGIASIVLKDLKENHYIID